MRTGAAPPPNSCASCVLERITGVFKRTHYHQREHKHSSRKTSVSEPRRCLSPVFHGTEAEQQTEKTGTRPAGYLIQPRHAALFTVLEYAALPSAFKLERHTATLSFPSIMRTFERLEKINQSLKLKAAGNPRCVLESEPLDVSHHLRAVMLRVIPHDAICLGLQQGRRDSSL